MKTVRFRSIELPRIIRCGTENNVKAGGLFPANFHWTPYSTDGEITITSDSLLPVKVVILRDGVVIYKSGYFGDTSYQSQIDTYSANNYEPQQDINPVNSYVVTITGSTTTTLISIKVYCPLPNTSINVNIKCL